MKREDVKVDGTYLAKVNGGVVPVRITGEKWTGDRHTGWIGVNTKTNRSVRIKSAQRLRGPVEGQEASAGATTPHAGEVAKSTAAAAPAKGAARAGKRGGTGEKAAKAKEPKPVEQPKPAKPKKTSALDAAAIVLAGTGAAMKPKEMIALMEAKGLWTSPGGKTPEATLYAAIIREISAKGRGARFRKTERGTFTATEHAGAAAAGQEG